MLYTPQEHETIISLELCMLYTPHERETIFSLELCICMCPVKHTITRERGQEQVKNTCSSRVNFSEQFCISVNDIS